MHIRVYFSNVLVLTMLLAVSARGVELTWDADTFTPGAQDGFGFWETSGNTNWWNGTTNVQWSDNDSAVVGAAGTPSTLIVSGTVNLSGLTIAPIDPLADGTYEISGGTLAFSGASPVITLNQPRDTTAPNTTALQRTRISAAISGSNLTFTSDILAPANVNGSGFLFLTGPNTNTGTITLEDNVTVHFFPGAFNTGGITGIVVNPTSTLDLTFAGTISAPMTLSGLGATDGTTFGFLPTHEAPVTANAGSLRLGFEQGGTTDVTSTITFAGDTEIQSGAISTGVAPADPINIVNINTPLNSEHHLTLRSNQGSQMNVNAAIDVESLGLRLNQSSGGGKSIMNLNGAVTANDWFAVTNANGTQLNVNAAITLTNRATVISSASTSGTTRINATITAPEGIEFGRGLTSVELNSTSGFAIVAPEILLSVKGGSGATTVIAKADDQISHDAVLHFSNTGINRALRLEGHTVTVGGLQTTNVTTASQAVIENRLESTTGTFIVNNAADHTFDGILRDGTGTGSVLNFSKQGMGILTLTGDSTYTGTTTVSGGALLVNGSISASPNVTVENSGTLGGIGVLNASAVTVNAGGFLAPGDATGTGLFSVGSADIDGTLKIEFGDNSVDHLFLPGGSLDLTNAILDLDGIGDLVNSTYVFATYGTLVNGNEFASILNKPDSLTVVHDTLAQTFSLVGEYVDSLPGDYNDDGFVNAADYVVWRDNPDAIGGGNPDGYITWKSNFGAPQGAGSGHAAAIPEPASWMLLICAALAILGIRRVSMD